MDPFKLEANQLSLIDVVRSLNNSNVILPGGDVQIGSLDYAVYANNQVDLASINAKRLSVTDIGLVAELGGFGRQITIAHGTISSRAVTMLDTGKMIGFLGTSDFERARQFYEGKLGWKILRTDSFAMVGSVGGHMVRIVKIRDFSATHATVLGWEVEDVPAAVSWLKSRGVEVERYPWVQDKETGIWVTPNGDKVAWFKDPDGNVLSVSQHLEPAS